MNEEDEEFMLLFGIRHSTKRFNFHQQYRYDNLKNALNFAETDNKHRQDNPLPLPS
jgi:hypothetical protein